MVVLAVEAAALSVEAAPLATEVEGEERVLALGQDPALGLRAPVPVGAARDQARDQVQPSGSMNPPRRACRAQHEQRRERRRQQTREDNAEQARQQRLHGHALW